MVYACMFPCMFSFVMFCMFCLYIVCIYMYIFMYMYICMCVYICMFYVYVYLYVCIYVCLSVYKDASLYVCVGTHFCLHKIYLVNCLSCRYLGCYLSVWHCYLGCILAFSFKIVKLNTTTCTKSSTQVIEMNLSNMNSLFLTLIVNNAGCMYLFIWINSD